LLTDTVGFIKDLPVWLIESFRSTLEEVFLSDVILLLLDGSDPLDDFRRKLTVALDTLLPKAQQEKIIPVINKIDLISEKERAIKETAVQNTDLANDASFISVTENEGLEVFIQRLHGFLLSPFTLRINVPMEDGISSTLSWLYENAEVEEIVYGKKIDIRLHCHERVLDKIRERIEELGGNSEILVT
jgi:GTP-binding protein HflX